MIALLACGGCAQLLGLDNTKFDQKDAPTDSPSVCDGATACVSTTGRSVCGQLLDTGTNAGQLLRVAAPTGEVCAAAGATDGPCALTIYGQASTSYFTAKTTDRVAGTIDDCGRYVVPDLDATVANVAIVIDGSTVSESATLLLDRMTVVGTDPGVDAIVVATTTVTAWGMQLDPATPPSVAGGYLVTFGGAQGPQAAFRLRVAGAAVGGPPTQPWGAYFTGPPAFGDLDPTLMASDVSGTAVVVPPTGQISLGGTDLMGKTCTVVMVQTVANALIHVTLSC